MKSEPPPASPPATVHATAVLIGPRAVLIRGPAGCGKSALALRLLHAADAGLIRFARLIGDDRVHVEARHGRVIVRPAAALAGLLEIRGLGIRRLPFEAAAVVGHVVDLAAADAQRFPEAAGKSVLICAVRLPRLAVAADADSVGVLTFLRDTAGSPNAAVAHI